MSRSMICHFCIDGTTIIGAEVAAEPPTFWQRKETGHYDGLYRIHHIEWNEHANHHEVIYMPSNHKDFK